MISQISGFGVREVLGLLLAMTAFQGLVFATTPEERDSLTNPVYRIENSEDVKTTEAAATATPVTAAASDVETAADREAQLPAAKVASVQPINPNTVAAKTVDVIEPAAAELTPQQALDLAVKDAIAGLAFLSNVRDYSCDFLKREFVEGKLLPYETIKLKVRNRVVENGQITVPFSVYMKFLGPKHYKNREVLYIENMNNGKLLIKEGGTRGRFLPSVWLKPTNSIAMQGQRYPITEVGMVNLSERLLQNASENMTVNKCKIVYRRDAKIDGRNCSYLEVYRAEREPGPLSPNNVYLARVFMDQQMNVPVRYACYDWPVREGGAPRLIEEYTYRNIELNTLNAEDFNPKNPAYRF